LPKVYEIENFSLKIILLFKNSGLIVSLKHTKKPTQWAGWWIRKRIFLIEKLTILLLILQHLMIVISLK